MKYTFALIVASLAVLSAVPQLEQDSKSESESESTEKPESVEDRINWVDINLIKTVPFDFKGTLKRSLVLQAALTDPSRSLICSPLSALFPLGKLVIGTERGKSRDELLSALGYTKNKVKKSIRSLIKKLKYLPGVTISLASTLYVSNRKEIIHKYQQDTILIFKSTIQKLDFENPVASATFINQKVSDGTNGKIKVIVAPGDISPSASLILVNAVYFSGHWKDPFRIVRLGDFHSPTGLRKVPMMSRQGDYNYVKSDSLRAQILELPYEGNKASFIIVLPVAQNISILLRKLKLDPEMLNRALVQMRQHKVHVTMPKFKIESELNLNVLFQKIGIKHIFLHGKSKLTRIIKDDKPWVSRAVQKAYIEVTEKGTEAAAATALEIVSMSLQQPIAFKADRPFLFFIKVGGEQLFAGIFTND